MRRALHVALDRRLRTRCLLGGRAPRYKISGAVVRVDDGRVLVAGGSATGDYDPTDGTFQRVADDANTDFSFAAAARLADGTVPVSGGYDDGIHLTDQVLRFVP